MKVDALAGEDTRFCQEFKEAAKDREVQPRSLRSRGSLTECSELVKGRGLPLILQCFYVKVTKGRREDEK